jgi:hypothetical protein
MPQHSVAWPQEKENVFRAAQIASSQATGFKFSAIFG